MRMRLLVGSLLGLLGATAGTRADVEITSPAPPASDPPAIVREAPLSTFLLFGGAPSAPSQQKVLPPADPLPLARDARQQAACLRLLKENRVFCLDGRAVPLRGRRD